MTICIFICRCSPSSWLSLVGIKRLEGKLTRQVYADFVSLRSLNAPVHNPDRVANLPTVSSSFPNRTSRCIDRMILCFYFICEIGKDVFVSYLVLVLYLGFLFFNCFHQNRAGLSAMLYFWLFCICIFFKLLSQSQVGKLLSLVSFKWHQWPSQLEPTSTLRGEIMMMM